MSFADAQQTLVLKYKSTLLYVERNETKTTGLDALAIRPQDSGFPVNPIADPPMPIPFQFNHLSLDLEGLVLNEDCRSVSLIFGHNISLTTTIEIQFLGQ